MGKKIIIIMLLSVLAVSFIGCCKQNTDPNDKKGSIQPSANNTQTDANASSSSPYKDQVLRLGRIPYNNSSQMVIQHEAFLKYLAEKIGVKAVRLQTAPDYSSIL